MARKFTFPDAKSAISWPKHLMILSFRLAEGASKRPGRLYKEVLFLALCGDDYHVLTKKSPATELVKQVTREFQHQHIPVVDCA